MKESETDTGETLDQEASGEGEGLDAAGAGGEDEPSGETPEAASETASSEEAEGPSELELLQGEIDQLRDQHLRLAADFENYRKRAVSDMAGTWIRARADLVKALVEGLDDLQRVSQFTSEDTTVDALIAGVDLVERNLLKGLTEAGLVVLNPKGERFDPNTMEAMMRVEAEEEGLDETVHQVFQKGYMFKDQLVRPACPPPACRQRPQQINRSFPDAPVPSCIRCTGSSPGGP